MKNPPSQFSPQASTAVDPETSVRLMREEMEALRAEVAEIRQREVYQARVVDDAPPLYE